jgi:predicted transcriptional regulator
MADTARVIVDLDRAMERRLEDLALRSGRSAGALAAAAIEQYVEVHDAFVAAVQEGIAAADRGELVSHDEIESWLREWASRVDVPAGERR